MYPSDPDDVETTGAYGTPRYVGGGRPIDAGRSNPGRHSADAGFGGGPYDFRVGRDDDLDGDRLDDGERPGRRAGPRLGLGMRVAIGAGVALLLVGALTLVAGAVGPRLNHARPANPGGRGSSAAGDPVSPGVSDSSTGTTASASPSSAPPPKPAPPKPPVVTATGNAGLEAQVVAMVNAERAKIPNCPVLKNDPRLTAAARRHSADMAARNYFEHTTPEGVEAATRILNEGYRYQHMGENIEKGSSTAAGAMNSWMKSPGHRANILGCDFRDIGVGVAADSGGTRYWTQDFGRQFG